MDDDDSDDFNNQNLINNINKNLKLASMNLNNIAT